jgi:hypothetical protein
MKSYKEEEIEQVRKEANNKIYYLILDDHKSHEEEIMANFNMGLITFIARLKQIEELNEYTLKQFKSNGITDYIN